MLRGRTEAALFARQRAWLVIAGALLLGACQTQTANFGRSEDDPDAAIASQANISSLSAAVTQNPSDANAYNVRGTAYGRAGKLKDAVADFDNAIRINPSFYQAYANRALVERRLNRDDLALADYNKAIELNPSYAVAYVGRGNIYRQNNSCSRR